MSALEYSIPYVHCPTSAFWGGLRELGHVSSFRPPSWLSRYCVLLCCEPLRVVVIDRFLQVKDKNKSAAEGGGEGSAAMPRAVLAESGLVEAYPAIQGSEVVDLMSKIMKVGFAPLRRRGL